MRRGRERERSVNLTESEKSIEGRGEVRQKK